MWTISNEQLEKVTTSLTKVVNKISEKAINRGVDIVDDAGKEKIQESQSLDENYQTDKGVGKSDKTTQTSNRDVQSDPKNNQQPTQPGSKKVSSKENVKTEQTIQPVLACEQVEVMSLTSYKPTELPQKEILKKRWLTEDDVQITTSLTDRNVKIGVETNGFFDGEKLKLKVRDSKNKVVKSLQVSIEGNRAITEVFNVEEEWLNKVLFITFES